MYIRSLLPAAVYEYITQELCVETPVQQRLRRHTALLRSAGMQIGQDQGQLLSLLVHLIGARRAIEVGTYTGYSALTIATALPADGCLVCCDVNRKWTDIARAYWLEAGVDHKIDLRLQPASTTIAQLLAGGASDFDFAFIDADKVSYDDYYEGCLRLLHPNGLMALDNTLWSGAVVDPQTQDPETVALRRLNLKIRDDRRVEAVLLSVGDGVTLARKR